MLTSEQQFVLQLLRVSMGVDVGPCMAPADVDAATVAHHVRGSGILLTVYPALDVLPEAKQALQAEYYGAIAQAIAQAHDGEQIMRALCDAGMRCMPLKGWAMAALYPEAHMRQMADLDILARPYDFETVAAAMAGLGFSRKDQESEWMHDNFYKGMVTVEVHKRLSDDKGAIRAWERGTWDRARQLRDGVCEMSLEDHFLFHFVHMHKDFCHGSLGLRRIVDTWLLDQRMGDMDADYVNGQLEAMGLTRFAKRMRELARACMGQEELDADFELLLAHAFAHGIYGTDVSYKAATMAHKTSGGIVRGKLRLLVPAVFLPYGGMRELFPVLERWPVLLPACWVVRIVQKLLGGRQTYDKTRHYLNVDEADLEEMRAFFAAGLRG